MSEEALAKYDAGEADYFGAILAMQSASQQNSAFPEPLLKLIQAVKSTVQKDDVVCSWAKPVLMGAPELAAFGAALNLTAYQRHNEGAQEVIAFEQGGIVPFANLLLGGKPVHSQRSPGEMENKIIQGFAALMGADFQPVEAPQASIIWQDYAGAKLAFSDETFSPFLVLLINRRNENTAAKVPDKPNIQQQDFLRRAVGNSVLKVDYVLDGGLVSLALLRNLKPGSVLPLASLSDHPLAARTNGKTMFRGSLKLTADHIGMNVTCVLTESRNE